MPIWRMKVRPAHAQQYEMNGEKSAIS